MTWTYVTLATGNHITERPKHYVTGRTGNKDCGKPCKYDDLKIYIINIQQQQRVRRKNTDFPLHGRWTYAAEHSPATRCEF